MEPQVDNILAVLWDATDEELAHGMAWYTLAHAHAARLSPDSPSVGAGVIAALSPQLGWGRNLTLAEEVFRRGTAYGVKGQTHANLTKADKILSGTCAPLEALGGDKVRSFYRAIMGDGTAVVVDRHAFALALADRDADVRVLRRVGMYERFAHTYVLAADAFRIATNGAFTLTPVQVQAVTWVTWRRQHGADWHDTGRKL